MIIANESEDVMATLKKLYRSCDDKILGGVGAGIGEYFEIDATLVRLVIALAFLSGFGFLAYILAWVIIPENPNCKDPKTGAEEIKAHADRVAEDIRNAAKSDKSSKQPKNVNTSNDFRFWLGLIIVFFAVSLIFQNIFGFALWHNFWPIILVAAGFVLIAGSLEKK